MSIYIHPNKHNVYVNIYINSLVSGYLYSCFFSHNIYLFTQIMCFYISLFCNYKVANTPIIVLK